MLSGAILWLERLSDGLCLCERGEFDRHFASSNGADGNRDVRLHDGWLLRIT
jgi:hypothetical protein